MEKYSTINPVPSTYNEIVFANRNKSFGAYDLRNDYDKIILISALASIFILSSVLIGPVIYRYLNKNNSPLDFVKNKVEVELMKLDPIEKLPPAEIPKIDIPNFSTVKFVPPVIKPDEVITNNESLAKQEDFKNAVSSNETNRVDSAMNQNPHIATPQHNSKKSEEEFIAISRDAEFLHGNFREYLQAHLKYPARAKRMEIEGTVTVAFNVSAEGEITDARIVRSLDPECDAEALRVVNSMPKWRPAMQNGYLIKHSQNVKIQFSIEEEE